MKAALRAAARDAVSRMTPEQRLAASEVIAETVWRLPEISGARKLLVFAALPDEVPTSGIIERARRRGISIVYPRCLPGARELELRAVMSDDLLRPGAHGIREPDVECPLVEPAEIDAALVPGLAWDRTGARLGRGAGYYDRLLAGDGWRGFRCGIFLDAQRAAALPVDAWDVRLDAVVTESGILRIA
jgi:5-formyltetrahydrofolate cyclo-ligase